MSHMKILGAVRSLAGNELVTSTFLHRKRQLKDYNIWQMGIQPHSQLSLKVVKVRPQSYCVK